MPEPDLYQDQTELYDLLVSREDHLGRLMPALQALSPLADREVVEAGAGSGRLTFLLAARAAFVRAFDLTEQMLVRAEKNRRARSVENCSFAVADTRSLPVESNSADLAVEGWSVLEMAGWEGARWKEAVDGAVEEMARVTRPGGTIVLIETLGTLKEKPDGPERFRDHYRFLEREKRLERTWVRTDYRFESVDQAVELVGFFFGGEMARKVRRRGSAVVPECTGLWWRRV